MHASTLNIHLFGSTFCKKGYSSHCRVNIKLSEVPPPNCGPKELKSFNINREHIYHSLIVNYRVWYLCASGKPRDVTGYRISGLGYRERRKPLEKMMGSIKETNKSGCRNMPGAGIHMIVVEFISRTSKEIILTYYIYCIRKVEENTFLPHASRLCFCFHRKTQTPVMWELSIVLWAFLRV